MDSSPHVAVCGAGLAGLVAARHLAAAGAAVTVFERRETVGGRVRTVEQDGYRFDRGFQVLFTAYPAVQQELDLEALDLRKFPPGACLARPGHRSILSDPIREPTALPATLRNPDIDLLDKLRVLWLRFDLSRTKPTEIFSGADRSIEDYLRTRGFSDRFIQNFAAPFYGGITLDRSLSTSTRIFEYTFKALSAGSIAVPAQGMGAIPRQLARRARDAGATIETNRPVESITPGEPCRLRVGEAKHTADAIVVATDPATALDLTDIQSIPTTARSCVTQYYGLPESTSLETGGRLLLNTKDTGPNQVVPLGEVAPEYEAPGATLISATYLGDRDESDAELADQTTQTLRSWYPERQLGPLELLHTDRIPFAQFAQPPHCHDTLPETRDPKGPVYLAGDYTRWSSIQGAMASGIDAATAVLADV